MMAVLFLKAHLIICIEVRSWQIYALIIFTFNVKFPVRTFLRSVNCHLPRFVFELAHPQHATHCLMRLKQSRVPITNGCAIQIPQSWKEPSFDL
jgi:hypothetical protein